MEVFRETARGTSPDGGRKEKDKVAWRNVAASHGLSQRLWAARRVGFAGQLKRYSVD